MCPIIAKEKKNCRGRASDSNDLTPGSTPHTRLVAEMGRRGSRSLAGIELVPLLQLPDLDRGRCPSHGGTVEGKRQTLLRRRMQREENPKLQRQRQRPRPERGAKNVEGSRLTSHPKKGKKKKNPTQTCGIGLVNRPGGVPTELAALLAGPSPDPTSPSHWREMGRS